MAIQFKMAATIANTKMAITLGFADTEVKFSVIIAESLTTYSNIVA